MCRPRAPAATCCVRRATVAPSAPLGRQQGFGRARPGAPAAHLARRPSCRRSRAARRAEDPGQEGRAGHQPHPRLGAGAARGRRRGPLAVHPAIGARPARGAGGRGRRRRGVEQRGGGAQLDRPARRRGRRGQDAEGPAGGAGRRGRLLAAAAGTAATAAPLAPPPVPAPALPIPTTTSSSTITATTAIAAASSSSSFSFSTPTPNTSAAASCRRTGSCSGPSGSTT